ncbi:hypothetical protein FF38_13377 [Lucilia cuprina]|uniref:Uncharacterized protein n=1 Tax=Lucilia cuprina TaxID=7375 RepID=A0A0L0BW55_LUCCU|nr:hypothetical protein FF38_13377 [Lucilia cuprina]
MKFSLYLISLALLGSTFGVNASKSSDNSTRSFKAKLCAMGKTQFCPPEPIPPTTSTLIPTDIITPTLPPTPPIPTTTDTGLPTTSTTGTSPTTETLEPITDTSPTTSLPDPDATPEQKKRKTRRNGKIRRRVVRG